MKNLIILGAALLIAATTQAGVPNEPEDTIPPIVPLFDPIVIEDDLSFDGEPSADDLLKMEYNTDFEPTRSGTAYKVGTPSTEASVSELGAAVWSMAFDVPAGVGGMTPSVGLVYSSQSGNGNAGWGVSISGVSSITRGPKTAFYDSTVGGVKYDPYDALFLDGRRLLLYSGNAGTSGAIYYPEGDPYTKVKVTSANTTTGPLAFEVTLPNGHIIKYGGTADSRNTFTDANSVQRVHSWYVNRDEDPNGNYMLYTYMKDHVNPNSYGYYKNRHLWK